MKLELNIGLDIKGHANSTQDRALRASKALHQLSGLITYSQRFVTEYTGPDGRVTEHGLFVALNSNNKFATMSIVACLAVSIGQDCIAIYDPETGVGSLVGPQSENWGSFQLEFFKRCDQEQERLAA